MLKTILFIFFIAISTACSDAESQSSEPFIIVTFGDSLMSGHGISRDQAYAAQLERALKEKGYKGITVINAGISGDTTSGGFARVDKVILQNPDLVLLELGVNDAFRKTPTNVIYRNLMKIIEKLQGQGINVILMGMQLPPAYDPIYTSKFKGMYNYIHEKHDIPLYPFFLEGVAQVPEYNNSDGIHPNPKGIAVIVENSLDYITGYIDDIR